MQKGDLGYELQAGRVPIFQLSEPGACGVAKLGWRGWSIWDSFVIQGNSDVCGVFTIMNKSLSHNTSSFCIVSPAIYQVLVHNTAFHSLNKLYVQS